MTSSSEPTIYSDPSKKPWDYHSETGDAYREASANRAESFVYTGAEMLRSCWENAHKVVFEREEPSGHLTFLRIEDAQGDTIVTPEQLTEAIGEDDDHPALIGVHHLYAAYPLWAAGATRHDERAWSIESTYRWQGTAPYYSTFTLPALSPEPRAKLGIKTPLRIHRLGLGQARLYDAGTDYSVDRTVVRLRHVLTVAKTTVSLTGEADDPGQKLTIELDPTVTQITINGTIINL